MVCKTKKYKRMKGFFKSISGRDSSTRLIGFAAIVYAMVMGFLILYWGKDKEESIIMLSTAAGTFFSMIAGPVFIWMFNQKKTEVKQEKNEGN